MREVEATHLDHPSHLNLVNQHNHYLTAVTLPAPISPTRQCSQGKRVTVQFADDAHAAHDRTTASKPDMELSCPSTSPAQEKAQAIDEHANGIPLQSSRAPWNPNPPASGADYSSAPHSSTTDGSQHESALSDIMRILQEVVTLREGVVGKRVDIHNQRQHYTEQRGHASQAQRSAQQMLESFALSIREPSKPKELHQESLDAALNKSMGLNNIVDEIDADLREKEAKLNVLEYNLKQKELELYRKLAKYTGFNVMSSPPDHQYFFSELSSGHTASSDSSSEHDPEVVTEYYDCVGEAKNIYDVIYNHHADLQRQQHVRDAQRNRGQKLVPPDEQFYAEHIREHQNLIKTYKSLQEKVERLRGECRKAYHDVEEPGLRPLPDFDQRHPHSHRSPTSLMASNFRRRTMASRLLFVPETEAKYQILQNTYDKKFHVQEWLTQVENPDEYKHLRSYSHFYRYLKQSRDYADVDSTPRADSHASYKWDAFQGDPPKRRYSEPHHLMTSKKHEFSSAGPGAVWVDGIEYQGSTSDSGIRYTV